MLSKKKIKFKVKEEFKINERDYNHEWFTFGYIYELVDFIIEECEKELKEKQREKSLK